MHTGSYKHVTVQGDCCIRVSRVSLQRCALAQMGRGHHDFDRLLESTFHLEGVFQLID